jgi:hypothetical protein
VTRRFGRGSARESGSAPATLGWREAIKAAAAIVRARSGLLAIGLLGFLARGGAIVFVLPIVVLPTPTGVSNFIGSQALTAGGPSEGLIWLLAAALAGAMVLILAGTVIGAAADLLLLREAATFVRPRDRWAGGPQGRPSSSTPSLALNPGLLLRLTLVRLLWMLPVAVAAVWAASRLVDAAYHQLILPDDLTVPLAIRVLRDAADAAAVVTVTWLLAETFAGLAARRLILGGGSIARAIGWAIVAPLRRPLTTAATLLLGTAGLVLAVVPPLLLANLLWRRLQVLLDGDQPAALTLVTISSFVAVWGLGLLLVALLATWRSLAWSFEVLRAGRPGGLPERTERPVDSGPADRSSLDQPLLAGGGAR